MTRAWSVRCPARPGVTDGSGSWCVDQPGPCRRCRRLPGDGTVPRVPSELGRVDRRARMRGGPDRPRAVGAAGRSGWCSSIADGLLVHRRHGASRDGRAGCSGRPVRRLTWVAGCTSAAGLGADAALRTGFGCACWPTWSSARSHVRASSDQFKPGLCAAACNPDLLSGAGWWPTRWCSTPSSPPSLTAVPRRTSGGPPNLSSRPGRPVDLRNEWSG
jgi:hypothetical protein